MKYYVYIEKHGEIQAQVFVNDLQEFAKHYDPERMSFSGVVIDANNEKEAMAAYEAPNNHLETSIAWIPEPLETAEHAIENQVTEDINVLSYMLRCSIISLKISKALQECNKQLAQLAHYIRIYNKKNPEVDKRLAYDKLKTRYVEYFKRLHYKPFTPDED